MRYLWLQKIRKSRAGLGQALFQVEPKDDRSPVVSIAYRPRDIHGCTGNVCSSSLKYTVFQHDIIHS